MTDAMLEIGNGGSLQNAKPVSTLGNVVVNCYKDSRDIEASKLNEHAFYQLPTDNDCMHILQREVAWAYRIPRGGKRTDRHQNIYVRTTVNGCFTRGEPLHCLEEQIRIVGVTKTYAIHDSDGHNDESDCTVQVGGSTSIKNTGNQRICNGQWVYAALPDPSAPYGTQHERNAKRAVLWTLPVRPEMDTLTQRFLYKVTIGVRPEGSSNYENLRQAPIYEAAEVMSHAILQLAVDSFHAFCASGIVRYDGTAVRPDGAGAARREENAAEYQRENDFSNETKGENVLLHLSEYLGLLSGKRGKHMDLPVNYTSVTGAHRKQITTTLRALVAELVFAKKSEYMLFPLIKGKNPGGQRGEIVCAQQSAIADIYHATEKVKESLLQKVIGQALTSAPPGGVFDIVLGPYQR